MEVMAVRLIPPIPLQVRVPRPRPERDRRPGGGRGVLRGRPGRQVRQRVPLLHQWIPGDAGGWVKNKAARSSGPFKAELRDLGFFNGQYGGRTSRFALEML